MTIAADVIADLEAHAREAAPEECCGLLIGTADAITASVRARNTAAEPHRCYRVDPRDHFSAIRRARAAGLDVIGAYHSHPASLPLPSETDRAEAFEGFIFLIIGRSDLRAWRLSSGNFTEVSLVVLP